MSVKLIFIALLPCCWLSLKSFAQPPLGFSLEAMVNAAVEGGGKQHVDWKQSWQKPPYPVLLDTEARSVSPIGSIKGDAMVKCNFMLCSGGGVVEAGAGSYKESGDPAQSNPHVSQAFIKEEFHDAIQVNLPDSLRNLHQVEFELSFVCERPVRLETDGENTFAGFNFTVVAAEAAVQMQPGDPLAYCAYQGNIELGRGVYEPNNYGTSSGKRKLVYTVTPGVKGFDLLIGLQAYSLCYCQTDCDTQVARVWMNAGFIVSLRALTPGVTFSSWSGYSYQREPFDGRIFMMPRGK